MPTNFFWYINIKIVVEIFFFGLEYFGLCAKQNINIICTSCFCYEAAEQLVIK